MVWVYHSLFNGAPVLGRLECFQFLAIATGVAVN